MKLLQATAIQKAYQTAEGRFEILKGVDVSLDGGETVALTGESGSGKSTLLHLIGGLDVPDTGSILIEGQDIAGMADTERAQIRRETVGVVFQQFNLIPSLTVADNIAFQARLSGSYDTVLARDIAVKLGIDDQLRKYPEQLSGGQQQRVAIARTLAAKPKLVLADEPTGNLDEDSAETVMTLFRSMVTDAGAGLLLVTHSQRLAGLLDRQLHLRAGRIT